MLDLQHNIDGAKNNELGYTSLMVSVPTYGN